MPGLFDRVARLARTPKGRQVIAQATAKAQQLAKDPATRARLERVRDQVARRAAGRRPPSPPTP